MLRGLDGGGTGESGYGSNDWMNEFSAKHRGWWSLVVRLLVVVGEG